MEPSLASQKDFAPVVSGGEVRGVRPVDLEPLAPVAVTPPEAIRAAVEKARATQRAWAGRRYEDRVDLLGVERDADGLQEATDLKLYP